MGDIADSLIDGTFDSMSGEYLGEGYGYPRSLEWGDDFKHNHVKGIKKFLSGKGIYNSFQHEYCVKYLRELHNKEYKGGMSWQKIGEHIQNDWGAFVNYVKLTPNKTIT